jgi:hypothetical protein
MGSYRYVLACAAGLMLAGFSLVSSGPSSGGLTTQFLNIPAASLVGRISTTHNSACGFFAQQNPQSGHFPEVAGVAVSVLTGSFVAPVYLPQGATVTALSLFARDKEFTEDIHIFLIRKKTQDGTGANMGYATMATTKTNLTTAGGNMKVFVDNSVGAAVIDNRSFTYYVEFVSCNALDLNPVSMRITYTTP